MKLHEHPDFEQAILQAAEHFRGRGLRPAIIEKDYFVTETLRIIAMTWSDQMIFKGGTSLSKGWNLIHGTCNRGKIHGGIPDPQTPEGSTPSGSRMAATRDVTSTGTAQCN
jgi:hypothetical protein